MWLSSRLIAAVLGAGAVAAVVPLPGWSVLVAANLLVAALVAGDVLSAPRPADLGLAREHPAVLALGVPAAVTLRLHNPSRRSLAVSVRDATPRSMGRSPDRHHAVVAPGRWVALAAEVTPSRRGNAELGPVAVRTSGPLGLAGRQATLPLRSGVKVYPALPSRKRMLLRLERARVLQMGEHSSAMRGGGTDFDSLREYHPDDEFRRINWKATARSAKPITNLYREERNQQVLVLIDASRMMAASIGGLSRFEHAIDASVAVAELAARVGDQVGMMAFGSRVLAGVDPRTGRGQPRVILDAIYDLEPRLEAPNYRQAFATLLRRSRRRSLILLLTELTDETAMAGLFEAVPALVSRHLVILAAVLDPEVERMATAAPSSSEEAYLRAAAAGALVARERTAARLAGMGVVVVDRPPGELAGRVVDEYLRIKAHGRL